MSLEEEGGTVEGGRDILAGNGGGGRREAREEELPGVGSWDEGGEGVEVGREEGRRGSSDGRFESCCFSFY